MRCVFRLDATSAADVVSWDYEERITLWHTGDLSTAIRSAEEEAQTYAALMGVEYLLIAQAYKMSDPPVHAAEVFSLVRNSTLGPDEYVSGFFATGGELESAADSSETEARGTRIHEA